ncbi:unnamed protein product [Calicophoron daubneyi]|uniref:Uncharacterized protein n=1 Tax=Calicophoron daubneyi TaxID=300641 RepID=A0AAV2SYB5_CALDB
MSGNPGHLSARRWAPFMSTTSKITLGLACVFSASIVAYVHIAQALERERLSESVRKEVEREIEEAKRNIPLPPDFEASSSS